MALAPTLVGCSSHQPGTVRRVRGRPLRTGGHQGAPPFLTARHFFALNFSSLSLYSLNAPRYDAGCALFLDMIERCSHSFWFDVAAYQMVRDTAGSAVC